MTPPQEPDPRRLHALLRKLLPRGIGEAALVDLERELELRRIYRGSRWSDGWWLAWVVAVLAIRLRIAGMARRSHHDPNAPRGAAETSRFRMISALAGFGTDLRFIVRGLTRNPGLSLAAVVVLALGVAAPTTMYSFTSAVVRTAPLFEPEQLVTIRYASRAPGTLARGLTREELEVVRGEPGALGVVAAYAALRWDFASEGRDPEWVAGALVTHDLFEVLGARTLQGREFSVDDEGKAVAVVGERLWRTRFGADPTILGSTIRLNGAPHTVIGILPSHLLFPDGAEAWVPIASIDSPAGLESPRYSTVGRLPPDVTLESVDAMMRGLAMLVSAPEGHEPNARFVVARMGPRVGVNGPDAKTFTRGLLGMVSCLLLVASANVANLLLCRAVARQQDLAVRTALGAGRLRIVASHMAEAAVLAVTGGLIGILLASGATSLLRIAFAGELDWWTDIRVDAGMLSFALVLTGLSALVAGAVPAAQATRRDTQPTLRGDVRSAGSFHLSRVSEALVVGEVMFSMALLIPALRMADGILDGRRSGSFETREVFAAAYTLRPAQHPSDAERLAFHRTLLERVAERSGVAGAAIVAPFPGQLDREPVHVKAEGRVPADIDLQDYTDVVHVTPGAFDVLDAPLLRGRDITWRDGAADPPAVVVNEAFAIRFFESENPLGRLVRFRTVRHAEDVVATIVGVVPVLAIAEARGDFPDAIYVPLTISQPTNVQVLLRAASGHDPRSLARELRGALATLDPDKPLHSAGTLRDLMRRERRVGYAFAGLFVGTGLSGLLMAGTGLYAVMAFAVSRRKREVGVRVALGASPARVVWSTLRQAAIQLTQGVFLGLVLVIVAGPALEALSLREGSLAYAAAVVTGVLLATGLLAALVPILRAVSIQPSEALQAE